jgi:hypothetical protein
MVRRNVRAETIGRWRCRLLPAVGTEPTGGSPTGKEVAMETAVTMLALAILLMVIDRRRE